MTPTAFALIALAGLIHAGWRIVVKKAAGDARFALFTAVVMMVLYAMKEAPLSHAPPARVVSMLFAALIGGHLLGEGDRLNWLLGAVMIAAVCGLPLARFFRFHFMQPIPGQLTRSGE